MIEGLANSVLQAAIDVAKEYFQVRIEELKEKSDDQLRSEGLERTQRRKLAASIPKSSITANIVVDPRRSEASIKSHLDRSKQWCSSVYFKNSTEIKKLSDIYIHLDTYLIPMARHVEDIERQNRAPIEDVILDGAGHLLIQGLPGAGKTTAMKRLLNLFFFEDNANLKNYSLPILFRLREFEIDGENTNTILQNLYSIFHYNFEIEVSDEIRNNEDVIYNILEKRKNESFLRFLDELRPIIILDGLDEITNADFRKTIEKEINDICRTCRGLRIIITCRTGEFKSATNDIREFQIAPLTWLQVSEFSGKWIKDTTDRDNFVHRVRDSPFSDTALKPLSLAHLCAIYERTGSIPEKPKAVYHQIITLLLKDWDQNRGIVRTTIYSSFDVHEKFEFLCNLSFYFSVELKKYVMSDFDLRLAYDKLKPRFGLMDAEMEDVIAEIESHTGLFVQSGAQQFEFAHKSLQEYLAAEHIIRMPTPPTAGEAIEGIPSELAVAVSISSEPNEYLKLIVFKSFMPNNIAPEVVYSFVNRLVMERIGFFETRETITTLLMLLSLWFCHGEVPKRTRLKNSKSSNFVGGYSGVAKDAWPPVQKLFRDGYFYSQLQEFLSEADVRYDVGPNEKFVSVTNRRGSSKFKAGRGHFVLPKELVDQAAGIGR